jgi:hypothetical protein
MIRVQVFVPLGRFACAHSTRKTSTAISEPIVWKIAAGAFMESARILFDVIASQTGARVAIESLSTRSKTSNSATTSKDSIRWAIEGWLSLIVATLS